MFVARTGLQFVPGTKLFNRFAIDLAFELDSLSQVGRAEEILSAHDKLIKRREARAHGDVRPRKLFIVAPEPDQPRQRRRPGAHPLDR
ncbi:MAG TPA: hypothetical protein VK171_11765 [Fimbriimonas sp.]|nr:hypothetical protein [Fimbriimonas sp.]